MTGALVVLLLSYNYLLCKSTVRVFDFTNISLSLLEIILKRRTET